MKHPIKLSVISVFTLLLNSYVLANDTLKAPIESTRLTEPHASHCHEKLIPPHLMGLNLSQEQEDKIFALIYPTIPTMRELEKKRQALLASLRKLANNDASDETKAKQLSEQLATLDKESHLQRFKIDHQIYTILTESQRKKLEELPTPHFLPHGFGAKHTLPPNQKMVSPHALM